MYPLYLCYLGHFGIKAANMKQLSTSGGNVLIESKEGLLRIKSLYFIYGQNLANK